MKPQQSQLNVILIFAAAVTALLVAARAEVGSGNTTSRLTRRDSARAPRDAEATQIYAAQPPYHVHRATVNGHVFYVYKDEKAGLADVGREPEYQRYH